MLNMKHFIATAAGATLTVVSSTSHAQSVAHCVRADEASNGNIVFRNSYPQRVTVSFCENHPSSVHSCQRRAVGMSIVSGNGQDMIALSAKGVAQRGNNLVFVVCTYPKGASNWFGDGSARCR